MPAKTLNNIDIKIGEIHAIAQYFCGVLSFGEIKPCKISCCCCGVIFLLCLVPLYILGRNMVNILEYCIECNTT